MLGATRFQTFRRVIFPALLPATLTGFALAFARSLGEYGSVVFISGNMPMRTEITPLLIVTKLEQYDYAGATRDRRGHAPGVLRHAALGEPAGALGAEGRGMSGIVTQRAKSAHRARHASRREPARARRADSRSRSAFWGCFWSLRSPPSSSRAFSKGVGPYWDALTQDDTVDAIWLTLLTAGIAVPLNVVFGIAAAWLISKYDFWGKSVLITVVDSAVQRLAGDLRLDFRLVVWRARLVRSRSSRITTSRSFSRCPAS